MSIVRSVTGIVRDVIVGENEPEKLPRIGKSGPPVGLIMPPTRVRRTLLTRPALEADSRKIADIIQRADVGQTCDLADLYEDCRMLDARLDVVGAKRVMAIMGRPLIIKPAPGAEADREAKDHAEIAQRLLLGSPRWYANLQHLASAVLDIPRVCEREFIVTRDGYYQPVLHRRWPNLFAFDDTMEMGFLERPGFYSSFKPLSDYPDRFVVHAPCGGRSSYPWRMGAMRSRLVPSIAKRAGVRWWLQYLERFGMPLPYAKLPINEGGSEDNSDSLKERAKQMLRDLQADFSAVLTGGIELDTIPQSGAVNTGSHKDFVEYQDTQDAIVILGQNLTTEVTGGSFAATEAHRYVADDILAADLLELAGDTITQQILEPLNRYNWPGGPPLVAEMVATRAQVFSENDVAQGIASPDERRATLGHTAQPDGQGTTLRKPMAQVPAQLTPSSATPITGVAGASAPDAVAATALNGAQVTSLQGIVTACAAGQLPISAAKVMIANAFPTITDADIAAMFADVQPTTAPIEAPAGGGGAPPPFAPSSPTNGTAPSQTSAHSMSPLARALSKK